jgi:hypothetical protein
VSAQLLYQSLEISNVGRETIGSVTGWEPGWETDMAYEMAQCFLAAALGTPPPGVEIGTVWHDHDLGSYPSLAVIWDDGTVEPWEFVRRAENALAVFEDAIDWSRIKPSLFIEDEA